MQLLEIQQTPIHIPATMPGNLPWDILSKTINHGLSTHWKIYLYIYLVFFEDHFVRQQVILYNALKFWPDLYEQLGNFW